MLIITWASVIIANYSLVNGIIMISLSPAWRWEKATELPSDEKVKCCKIFRASLEATPCSIVFASVIISPLWAFFSHGKNFACSGRSKKTSKVDHHLEGGKTKIASNRTNRKKETAERMIELTSNTVESTSSESSN